MDAFSATRKLNTASGNFQYAALADLEQYGKMSLIPYSIRILLEAVLRNCDGKVISEEDVVSAAAYDARKAGDVELAFKPARVVLQDFTGVPAIVDLAAMRSAMQRLGGDPQRINPLTPVDLVVDHSVQVDNFGNKEAFKDNVEKEFQRNQERYEFLHWGQSAFENFRVIPPATGIVHQVNLEYLATVVLSRDGMAMPDTLVGTDSHTTMINGLGVVGWGVGGIEAEAAMLGQPLYMRAPEVIGCRLTGEISEGVTGTDVVLTVTELLRKKGVVGKFIEYFGPALEKMSLPSRAMIANMAPEYGATMGYFPVDNVTLDYLRLTGRTEDAIDLVERYMKEQGLFRTADSPDPIYTDIVELDLSTVESSLAGPKRPQDRIPLSHMKSAFQADLSKPISERGFELPKDKLGAVGEIKNGYEAKLHHGSVVIAAITSCTNTSDPYVLMAAGLLAKKATEKGLASKPWVKTSLAPGSRVVIEYLKDSGLLEYLEKLGFHNVGFGCTTCIGNSGPLPEEVTRAITENDLVAASVLSGNRNFEGRINPHTLANYLASPPLVVAYALAGTVDIDLVNEPLGIGTDGSPVYLKDIWPSDSEITNAISAFVTPDLFREQYRSVNDANPTWNAIKGDSGVLYNWDDKSTYIQEPPFFVGMSKRPKPIEPIHDARVLAMLGDSITTDHISPAGAIKADSPSGAYLMENGVQFAGFNSYGSRRGNDQVMTRGTFANIRLRNLLVPGSEGGVTKYHPSGETMSIYAAAMKYRKDKTSLIVIAGKDYGMGSSRDWAAKGTLLLGVRAVIAESYERIHRSNLVGMGVLPLEFKDGANRASLELKGDELFSVEGLSDDLRPRQTLSVKALSSRGELSFDVIVRIDTEVEIDYYRHGGILPLVIRELIKQ